MEDKLHNCDYSAKFVIIGGYQERYKNFYGPAIEKCCEIEGALFVDNNEYRTQVNFCPYCGAEAAVKVKYEDRDEYEKRVYG